MTNKPRGMEILSAIFSNNIQQDNSIEKNALFNLDI
jgi:hypothetical protein